MELDHLRDELSDNLKRYSARNGAIYATVTVLALLWAEDDLGVIEEVDKLSEMFQELFHFQVRQFVIPSERSQAALARAVSEFVFDFGAKDNLILVYYGGHGDPDRGGDMEAVWAAKIHGGPTLRWHHIQPILEGAEADVVLLLDCCYAGQAARARSTHRVELLAAAAMNLMTPGPRDVRAKSFTKALLEEIPRLLNNTPSFTLTSLHRQMVRKEAGLVQQPFYSALFEDSRGSIVLQPLTHDSMAVIRDTEPKESTAIVLRLSMFQKPNHLHMDQILKWLTTARPSTISAITVETVFSKALASKALGEDLVQPRSSDASPETWLNDMSIQGRADIKAHLESLERAISFPSPDDHIHVQDIAEVVDNIQARTDALQTAVDSGLSELNASTLQQLSKDGTVKRAGLSSPIEMRLLLLEACTIPDQATSGKIKFSCPPKTGQRLRFGDLGGDRVLVEYWYYDAGTDATITIPSGILLQVKKVAALHARLKSPAFRTLPGKGYVHELLPQPRFGMTYLVPTAYTDHDLSFLFDLLKSITYVPLESRIKLACTIAVALLQFHTIGWLHKGIKSENILLFIHKTSDQTGSTKLSSSSVEFLNPFVFGFDYSRPQDAESALPTDFSPDRNLYRHPERWGRPVRFDKKHDIYALGVLLLEIGFWRRVASLDPNKNEFRMTADPEGVKKILLHLAGDRLAHSTGNAYAAATRYCLSCDLDSVVAGQNQSSKILKAFRENVVHPLESFHGTG